MSLSLHMQDDFRAKIESNYPGLSDLLTDYVQSLVKINAPPSLHMQDDLIRHNGDDFRAKIESNYPGLSDLLIDYNGIIAGGSVLAHLTDNEHTDIDIWIFKKNSKAFLKAFEELPGFKKRRAIAQNGYINSSTYNKLNGLHSLHEYKVNGAEDIDILVCNDGSNPIEQVRNFDIDVCKCFFDGKVIYSVLEDMKVMTATPSAIEEVIKIMQSADFRVQKGKNNIFSRLLKYSNRGFKLKLNDSLKDGQMLIELMSLKCMIVKMEHEVFNKIMVK